MWIGPTIAMILSLVLAPLALSDVAYAEPSFPEKYVPDRLLIKFKKDVSNSHQNKLLDDNDISVISEIKPLGVKLIKVPEHALEKVQAAFAKNSAVEYVEKDYLLEPAVIPNDPNFSNQWHLQAINAPEAWDVTQGSQIPIAILDTGVDPDHPDLQGKLIKGYNWYNDNSDYSDVCGHGTKVAGSAAAITNNNLGVSGVAWSNPIIPIRITDTNCYGYYSSMINGIIYAADNGARAANISFAIFNGAALSDAAQYMYDRGGWVVAAAGNSGAFENYSENPYIISVSATASSDTITSWSSYGPYVDFAAPGSSIYTTTNGGSYGYTSGTSFSSPIVAGVVALVFSNDPSMTSAQAYDALKNSAVDKGSAGWDNMYGWGLVDVHGALIQNGEPPIDSTPPSVTITSPQNGEQVNDIFTVSVDSSDNVAVNVVELYLDGTPYDQKTSQPFDFSIDANSMPVGSHEIKAVSNDFSGNSNFDTITVDVDGTISDVIPPNVSITNPADGSTMDGTISVNVDATDDAAVTHVELFVNGILHDTRISSPYDFTVDSNELPTGTNTLMAKAHDSSNNSNEDSINVLVQANNLSPSISITNPTDGSEANGRLTITAQASNYATTPVVKFFIDGVQKGIDASPPYEYGWHTKGESAGTHTITVEASDNVENTASDSVSVLIVEKGAGKEKTPGPGKGKKNQEANLIQELDDVKDVSEIFRIPLFGQSIDSDVIQILEAPAPDIDDISPKTVAEGETLTFDVTASGGDDTNPLMFPQPAPDEMPSFGMLTDNEDGTATLEFTPGFEDEGVYDVTITALVNDDDPPQSDTKTFELTVTDVNQAPVLEILESEETNEGLHLSVPFFATDLDADDVLSFSAENLPDFVMLVDGGDRTGSLEISPDFDDVGEYVMTVTVSDNSEPEPLTDSKDFTLTVLESTPSSVITYLQNQKSQLSSEEFKNLGEKVSFAAKLHVHLVGATKQERTEFQDAFHDYINEAKGVLNIGQGAQDKMIAQEISKAKLNVDLKFEKIQSQEETDIKLEKALLLKKKKAQIVDTINEIAALEHLVKGDKNLEKLVELEAKKLALQKEVMIQEIQQSDDSLTDEEIKKLEEDVDKKVKSKSTGQGSNGDKGNNGKGDSGKDNGGKVKASDKGNKGGKGKSKK